MEKKAKIKALIKPTVKNGMTSNDMTCHFLYNDNIDAPNIIGIAMINVKSDAARY